MKILHVNFSDNSGGSAIALKRLHTALRNAGVDSWVLVNEKKGIDDFFISPKSRFQLFLSYVLPRLSILIMRLFLFKSRDVNSLNYFSTRWVSFINNSDFDIVHLHWLSGEMLSISDISKINKPLVWTFHDMWAFCGSEHLTYDVRYIKGYNFLSQRTVIPTISLNAIIWHYKKLCWKKNFTIVCPSNWMANCVSESYIFSDWKPLVISNLIDTSLWRPTDSYNARVELNIPLNSPVLLFGAIGGVNSFHKGFDLLLQSLKLIKSELLELSIHILVIGCSSDAETISLGFPITFLGHVSDEAHLIKIYSSANVLLLPSRIDNLPNTAIEALACGTPVVAFNCCGLPDIVLHKKNGYLATAYDISDFAKGILWTLSKSRDLKLQARNSVLERFSIENTLNSFLRLYNSICIKY